MSTRWGINTEGYTFDEEGSFVYPEEFEDAKRKEYLETYHDIPANFERNSETGNEWWPDGTIHK